MPRVCHESIGVEADRCWGEGFGEKRQGEINHNHSHNHNHLPE